MDGLSSPAGRKLRARADQEVEGVIIGGEMVGRVENPVVKMKAFLRRRAFGVGSDHGVEGEESWVGLGTLGKDLVGIVEIVWVVEGNGGHKLS